MSHQPPFYFQRFSQQLVKKEVWMKKYVCKNIVLEKKGRNGVEINTLRLRLHGREG